MQGPEEPSSAEILNLETVTEELPDISLNKKTTRGFIEPNSTVQVEVIYNPVHVAQHISNFEVSVADGSIEPVTVTVRANTIDLPVYVQEQDIYLKYCMVDRLYQDSVVLHNRATSALRIKFEIPTALRDHVDVLPQNGVVQANSSFSAQLKFIPLSSIFKGCKKFFSEGQLLKIPIRIRVADQTRCVPFTVSAHVTHTDISFSAKELDFGCCSIYESVKMRFSMTNHCLLPQLFGFVSVPDFVTIQPNDGFGTLLPGETLDLEAVVHAKVLGDHNFSITCTTEIDRHFSLRCKATGVIPHLEVSQPLIRFAPTALGDVRQASFYISNNSSKTEDGNRRKDNMKKSFHIVVPEGIDLTVSPSVGTLSPGQRLRVQLTFGPTLKTEDIENEAMEAARQEILKEMEKKKAEEAENERVTESVAGNKKGKPKKGSSKPHTPKSPQEDKTPNPLETAVITDEARIAAMIKLKTNFEQRFEKILIPCFTGIGDCSHDKTLDYRLYDTVYLQVHLPAVKPELVLLSQNGSSIVDFSNVCIGQTKKLELTLKSISEDEVSLSTSAFPHDGTFQKVNATRDLAPLGLHQMILEFTPRAKAKYYEVVEVRTQKSTLHLHLHGCGVEPNLVVSPDSGTLDLGHVMVGEILHGTFTLKNNSEIDLQYGISMLSEKSEVVQAFSGPSQIGNSNKSGILPFQCTPHSGNIPRGETQEVTVKFNPDHKDSYRDVVIVNLLNQPQETRIEVKGQSWTGSMFVLGARDPEPSVTLHTLVPHIEDLAAEPEPEEFRGELWVVFICSLSAPKQTFSETVSIGNCRGAGVKADAINSKDKAPKPSGDFAFDPLKADYGPLVKALVINPPKGSVESCTNVPVTFQFSPPKELAEVGSRLQFNTMLTLKGETIEQFRVNFVAEIVK
ncbi:cilia- and flagella-associated protein 74-like [Bolinopsis microptera]|uniref:cilia- and flagella-associated protein 74-like n=1 Tax=Bolinopsis microptera TaxID=2820187 RepID=UPI003078BA5D